MSAPLAILKTGSARPELTVPGDFEDWFAAGLGVAVEVVDARQGSLPDPRRVGAVLITGSAAMVSHREPWSEAAAAWLRRLDRGTPVLGVCYGHQLLAHALGGRVGPNPNGRQIGTTQVTLAAGDDALLTGLPARLTVNTSHCECVLEPPPGALVLGATAADPHHVLRFGPAWWGVQFHPEFDAAVMRGYLDALAAAATAEGIDVAERRAAVLDTPASASILPRFAALAAHRTSERPPSTAST